MKRSAGILLHPTSLPSPYGIGDFGSAAYSFVDFLLTSGQSVWGVLPLTIPDSTGSPYASPSAMALNWMLMSPEQLVSDGLLDKKDLPREKKVEKVSHGRMYHQQREVIGNAFRYFEKHATPAQKKSHAAFVKKESGWLHDYALFMAIKDQYHGKPWYQWSAPLARREQAALRSRQRSLHTAITQRYFEQWVLHQQWYRLKRYAAKKKIQIYGDIPFFVTHDSVDVWVRQSQFQLDDRHRPITISGVPPDYFSKRGQIWDNPHYDWVAMEKDNFRWWIERFHRAQQLYDVVRLDHFRGYDSVWHIPYGAKTARHGRWKSVPGDALLKKITNTFPHLALIAEDLGTITKEVHALRKKYSLPGMRVLQFAYDGSPENYHLPKHHTKDSVVYTGTHDNDTTRGWYSHSAKPYEKKAVRKIFPVARDKIAWTFISLAFHSPAQLTIVPLQDVLNRSSAARMNVPGTKRGNWRWRFKQSAITAQLTNRLHRLTHEAKRTP